MNARKPHPSDASDEEWEFGAPNLSLPPLNVDQRDDDLREVFNGSRWPLRSDASWGRMPHDLSLWHTGY